MEGRDAAHSAVTMSQVIWPDMAGRAGFAPTWKLKGKIKMKLVTDCAADLPASEVIELDVVVAPLYIQFPEGEISSDDITPEEFYDRLEAMQPQVPSTAQPSPADTSTTALMGRWVGPATVCQGLSPGSGAVPPA